MINVFRLDSFSKAIYLSAAAHGLLVLFFTVRTFVIPAEQIELAAAIKVDIVDLPDKILDPVPAALPPKAQEKPVEKPEKPVDMKPEEKAVDLDKKQKDALARLKQDSALEKIKSDLAKEQKNSVKPGPTPTYKGNQITSGTELRGLVRAQHDEYVGSIESMVRRNWALPEWLSNKNLRAQVRIKLNDRGEVIEMKLIRPSGNPSFDENVLVTVQKSSPLPPPPERLEILLRNEGIVLGFPE